MASDSCRRLTVAAPPLVALLLFLQQACKCCRSATLFVDDPFISMRFAANLVQFGELSFNHGTRVEGYSNLLHVLLHALSFRLLGGVPTATAGIDAVVITVFIVSCLELVLLFGLFRSRLSDERERTVWYCTWVLTMAFWPFAFWATAGLETPLEGLAYLAIAFLTARKRPPSGMRLAGVAALLSCVTLIRFEGILIASCLAGVLALQLLGGAGTAESIADGAALVGRRRRAALGLMIGTLLPGAVYHVLRWKYFGSLFPNTYIAKATGGSRLGQLNAGAHYCGNWLTLLGAGLALVIVIVTWSSIGSGERKSGQGGIKGHPMVQFSLTLVVAKIALVTVGGGDWMPGFRMLVPVTPFALYLALRLVFDRFGSLANLRTSALVVFAVAIPFVGRGGPLSGGGFESDATGTLRKVPVSYVEMGQFVAKHFRGDDEIAIGEAGLIPFVALEVRFMDLFGLVDADMARQPGGMHRRVHTSHVIERRPLAIVFAHLNVQPPYGPYQYGPELLQDAKFHAAYRRVELEEDLDTHGWALYARRGIDPTTRGLVWLANDRFASRAGAQEPLNR